MTFVPAGLSSRLQSLRISSWDDVSTLMQSSPITIPPSQQTNTQRNSESVTLDSGRGKRRLFGRRVARFPRRAPSKNKVQGRLEGLPQATWVLGASAATPSNSRLL